MTHAAPAAVRSEVLHARPSPLARATIPRRGWWVPIGLVALSVVPSVGGAVRLVQLGTGAAVTPDNARFFAAPAPVVVHILTATVFCVLGAFQLASVVRRRWPIGHRRAGLVLLPIGITSALSGLWLTAHYPAPALDGPALYWMRQAVGASMLATFALSIVALLRRDFRGHGAWVLRAYALGIGAGTQVLTHLPLLLDARLMTETTRAVAMGAGWAINLGVVEWVLARRRRSVGEGLARAPDEMRAVVFEEYGGPEVLEVRSIARPKPGPGEVAVGVRASSINAADYRLMRADPFLVRLELGWLRPKRGVLGADVAGVIDEVGPGVTRWKVGDAVFGETSGDGLGGFAERVCVREDALVSIPDGTSFEEAAALPLASVTALQALRERARLRAGQTVLVYGAGGGVGTSMVQIAKATGARVTAVCGPGSVELVRALGADRVADYTREDVTRGQERFDVIVGVNGHRPLGTYLALLSPGGTYVMVGGENRQIFSALLWGRLRFLGSGKRCVVLTLDDDVRTRDLEEIRRMVAEGKLRGVIERTFDLCDVADAMRFVEGGHVKGKVVLRVGAAG